MNKLQSMSTFVAVVEAGSFIGAMQDSGLSKPAVSRQVADLEEHLGIRLLHRTTRRLSLTEEGRVYYHRCKEILAAVQGAEDEASANIGQAQGRLRVGAPQDFGVMHLAGLWGKFLTDNPQVQLDVVLSDRVVDLVEEGYDLVVRIGVIPDSVLVARKLATTRMVLCASPDYLDRKGMPSQPAELEGHDVIAYSYFSSGDEWHLVHREGAEARVRVHPRTHVNSGMTCQMLALAGQGMILQPDFMVHDDLRQGRLVEVLPDWQASTFTVYAIYPTRALMPMKVQRLRNFLVEAFSSPVWQQ